MSAKEIGRTGRGVIDRIFKGLHGRGRELGNTSIFSLK
jgi:hypothetical protein